MSKEDFKCVVSPIDFKATQDKWRWDAMEKVIQTAIGICEKEDVQSLSEENINFSGQQCGGHFIIINTDGGFVVRINYLSDEQIYNINVEVFRGTEITSRGYEGGMSYGKTGDKIEKSPMSREPFSDEENDRFIDKPIKQIEAFLDKQVGIEK